MERCINNQCRTSAGPCSQDEVCDEQKNTCAPPPECYDDQDCDDGLFCNGEESCLDGSCVSGEETCDAQQACREDTDKCLDLLYVRAQSLQQIFWKPFFFKQQYSLLILDTQATTRFDSSKSTLSLQNNDGAGTPEGVSIDADSVIHLYSRFIIMPICITSQAATGQWSVKIETESTDSDLFIETIEATFEVK
jgi:hypothetical protein